MVPSDHRRSRPAHPTRGPEPKPPKLDPLFAYILKRNGQRGSHPADEPAQPPARGDADEPAQPSTRADAEGADEDAAQEADETAQAKLGTSYREYLKDRDAIRAVRLLCSVVADAVIQGRQQIEVTEETFEKEEVEEAGADGEEGGVPKTLPAVSLDEPKAGEEKGGDEEEKSESEQ